MKIIVVHNIQKLKKKKKKTFAPLDANVLLAKLLFFVAILVFKLQFDLWFMIYD